MQDGKMQFRTARRKYAAGKREGGRWALLALLITLLAAACIWLYVRARPDVWEQLVDNARESTRTFTAEEAGFTPAPPLQITVTEEEIVSETVSQDVEPLPRVLIYHTHASEAYLLTEDEPYEASGSWRTLDNTRNVVAIGALLQATLLTEYGIRAIHDTGNYEAPKLASAYSRSLVAMEQCSTNYPTVTLYIDLHRDAYGKNEENTAKDYITLSGKEVARIMLVVGTGEGATGSGFGEMPNYEANLQLAERITERLRKTDERLARDIRVKTGRYNQHVSDNCMLVEVGHTANTFTQAVNSVPYLAEAIAEILKSAPEPDTLTTMRVWTP